LQANIIISLRGFKAPLFYLECIIFMIRLDQEMDCYKSFLYKASDKMVGNQINLTKRFHVAVSLFSNRTQMTSKCGKNKNMAHEAIAECVTDVLTIF